MSMCEEGTAASHPRWTSRVARWLPTPSVTPFTFWYLMVLLATTVIQRVVDENVSAELLQLSSTDAHNLWHRPIESLVSSALWITDSGWVAYVLIFAFTVAPLERRIGAGWTFAVFASGHVLATLASELPVMWSIDAGWLPETDGHWLDIGVSYGFFATAGAMLTIVTPRLRPCFLLAADLVIVVIYLTDEPGSLLSVVTLAGHLIALHIGLLGWRGWLQRRGLAGTLRFTWPTRRRDPDQVRPAAALAGSVPQ